jgi:hypothetical protein
VCGEFSHEFHAKDTVVFDYGEYGKKYYIILSGNVALMKPGMSEAAVEMT